MIACFTVRTRLVSLLFLLRPAQGVTSIYEKVSNRQQSSKVKKEVFYDANLRALQSNNTSTIEIEPKIVNGVPVPASQYPWFARATNYDTVRWGGCGGSLVSPEFVLTAAHCAEGFLEMNGGYNIGALCIEQADNCGQYEEHRYVTDSFVNPNFNTNTLTDDLALMKLTSPSTVTPVTMDIVGSTTTPQYQDGDTLIVIGFGSTRNGYGPFSSVLLEADIKYLDIGKCNQQYDGLILDTMICAQDTSQAQDSCQGDSGGPLFDPNTNELVGVSSWGNGCADPSYAGVYSRISSQKTWIESIICERSTTPPAFCTTKKIPTSSFPRTAPSPIPPSHALPTSSTLCNDQQISLDIRLTTDDFGFEIYWYLTRNSDGSTVLSSEFDLADNKQYHKNACLNKDECYTFTITDALGDGICCFHGQGSYSVSVDGTVVKLGGSFSGGSESTQVGSACTSSSNNKTPSAAPIAPSKTPTVTR